MNAQERRNEWIAARAQDVSPGSIVLDVGAGEGRHKGAFAHCEYKAHDAAKYRGIADEPGTSWRYTDLDYRSDITAIPAPGDSFDVVLCAEVLEHVPNPDEALAEMTRLLRPGGTLLATAPLGSGLHQEPFHFYGGFTPHWWAMQLETNGYDEWTIEPSGSGFLRLEEDLLRAGTAIRLGLPPWHPAVLGARLIQSALVIRLLDWLERRIPYDSHAPGYFVAAKLPPISRPV